MASNMAFTASIYPPSALGDPLTFMLTVFGQMLLAVIFSAWTWRVVWSFTESPAPFNHGITANRVVTLMFLLIGLVLTVPALYVMMKWPEASPGQRAYLSFIGSWRYPAAGMIGVMAFIFAQRAQRMIDFSLSYHRTVGAVRISKRELAKTAAIIVGAFVISAAVAYRPMIVSNPSAIGLK